MTVAALAVLFAARDAVARYPGSGCIRVDKDVELFFPGILWDRRSALCTLRAMASDDVLSGVGDLRRCRDAESGLAECADPGVLDPARCPVGAECLARVCVACKQLDADRRTNQGLENTPHSV